MNKIATCLWFDGKAEEAAHYYTSVFKNSKIHDVSRKGDGSVLVVNFEVEGHQFIGLNGGPEFSFTEAISISVSCESQQEVDELWETLTEGGEEGPCGWLKDKYGLSWQIVPTALPTLLSDPDPAKAQRVMEAMMSMKKIDVRLLEEAHASA